MTTTVVCRSNNDAARARAEVWMLVARAQAGDKEAFGQLYALYYRLVYTFINVRVKNWQVAEDLTAEAFVRGFRNIRSLRDQGKDPSVWFATIARRLVVDYNTSGRSRYEQLTDDILVMDRSAVGPEATPEDTAVDGIMSKRLLRAVNRLNPEQKECIALRFFVGLSVAETAAWMGKSQLAVKALQHRAMQALRRHLPDEAREW